MENQDKYRLEIGWLRMTLEKHLKYLNITTQNKVKYNKLNDGILQSPEYFPTLFKESEAIIQKVIKKSATQINEIQKTLEKLKKKEYIEEIILCEKIEKFREEGENLEKMIIQLNGLITRDKKQIQNFTAYCKSMNGLGICLN